MQTAVMTYIFIVYHGGMENLYATTSPSLEDAKRTSERSTKTYLYNFDPLKLHFYIVKLGFTGVYIIFLFLLKSIDCGYSLEPPLRGGSNEYPQSIF